LVSSNPSKGGQGDQAPQPAPPTVRGCLCALALDEYSFTQRVAQWSLDGPEATYKREGDVANVRFVRINDRSGR
jgi:hypothetical protein